MNSSTSATPPPPSKSVAAAAINRTKIPVLPSSATTTTASAAGGGGATAAAAKAPMSLSNAFGTLHMGSIADLIADDSMLDPGACNRASVPFLDMLFFGSIDCNAHFGVSLL